MRKMNETVDVLAGTLTLSYSSQGKGQAYLLLHGGAGPGSMVRLAQVLSSNGRAIVPTYPGFDGLPRPEWFSTVPDLTLALLALIEKLDLRDVVIVGNSVGGWVAAEMAVRSPPRVAKIILLNAVGLDPTAESGPILDPASLSPAELPQYSFPDPRRASPPRDAQAAQIMAANQKSLRVYAGKPFMHNPLLRYHLGLITKPVLVGWGESDRIVTPAYGRQFAQFIPGSRFKLIREAGHLPQIEQPENVAKLITQF